MSGEPQQLGGTAIKPVGWDRTGWEAIRYTIYNPDNGTILTRTPLSWIKITAFYCVYYTCLAAFWLACLNIFFLTIPSEQPKWTLDGSIIGSNPGVGIRPKNWDKRIDSSLFYLNISDSVTTPSEDGEGDFLVDYAKRMDMYLEGYNNKTGLMDCSPDQKEICAMAHGRCLFDMTQLGECQNYPYGYSVEVDSNGDEMIAPCIFLKLNKIFSWTPEKIDPGTLDKKIYDTMSDKLKTIIREQGDANNIYFDCMGRYPGDKDSVSITFYPPNQAIPAMYFPYRGGNYQSPMVAIKVRPARLGQLLHLECRAWYGGVEHSTKDKIGLVQFEVMVN